jgi:hypothetical protein
MWPPARDALDAARSCRGRKIPEAFEIQIIRPGEKQFTDTSSGVPVKKNIDTTTVLGIRLKMVF